MRRTTIQERPDWKSKVEALGLLFHSVEGQPYWFEGAYYEFTKPEIDQLEVVTNELHKMCLDAVDYVIAHNRFRDLAIPEKAIPAIRKSWDGDVPAIYGRFDFAFDGMSPPKLLEYNADTPTALLEAAVIQWHWLQERFPQADQFNAIWEGLVDKWKLLKSEGFFKNNLVHCASDDNIEDFMTITTMRDAAQEAGVPTEAILMKDIGWDSTDRCFVDLKNRPMQTVFKLYPWEWILDEEFSDMLLSIHDQVQWMEPIWKMILSNKGILAILWEMHPGHPYLLETHIGDQAGLYKYVKKPLLSREGANITIHAPGIALETGGGYGEEGFVYQDYVPLTEFDGNFPVIGSWVIDDASAGIGVRESSGPVTDNWARFVPHLFT